MCKDEKLYLKAKGSRLEKRNAQNLFKEARNKFDNVNVTIKNTWQIT